MQLAGECKQRNKREREWEWDKRNLPRGRNPKQDCVWHSGRLKMLMGVEIQGNDEGNRTNGGRVQLTFGAAPPESHKTRYGTRQLRKVVGMCRYANNRGQRRNVATTVTATAAPTL